MIRLQRIVAATMILGSALLATQVLQDFAFPGILGMLGLLGLRRRLIWAIRPQQRVLQSLLYLLLLVIFAFHYRFGALAGRGHFLPTAEMAWQTIARYFLATMVLVLYLGSNHMLPPTLALFHLAFCISAGQILLLDGQVTVYRCLELGAVVLTLLYVVTARPVGAATEDPSLPRSRRALGAFAALVLVTVNLGWILGSVMYHHQGSINLLSGVLWGERLESTTSTDSSVAVGFSASGRLSNVLQMIEDPDQDPVLTITSSQRPGYLRARAFDIYYRDSEWFSYGPHQTLHPLRSRPPDSVDLPGQQPIFRLARREATRWRRMDIKPRLAEHHIVFTPLGTGYLEMNTLRIERDENDIVYGPRDARPYRLVYAKSGYWVPPSRGTRRRCLDLPARLDPRVGALAERIVAGCDSPREKIDAVIAHFREHYRYQLGMDAPADQDPVTYFLLEAQTGYCEYFATGAALLLRHAGVPTRYVTGFLVTEQDPDTGLWLARNAHAHAWAEAWDDANREWVLVEATVQQDLTQAVTDEVLGVRGRLEEFCRSLGRVAFEYGVLGAALWLLGHLGPWPWLVLGAAAVWLVRWSRRREGHTGSERGPLDRLHRALRRVDRRARRRGFRRAPAETLPAFAARLGTQATPGPAPLPDLAAWYQRYAALRYRRDLPGEEVETLVREARRRHS